MCEILIFSEYESLVFRGLLYILLAALSGLLVSVLTTGPKVRGLKSGRR
jgi:hypothetical protein